MTSFTNNTLNPIIPSQYSFVKITLTPTNTELVLKYPYSFISNPEYLAQYINVDEQLGFTEGKIIFDDARLAAQGTGTLITNIGADPFTVLNSVGDQISLITAGQSILIFLTDNTTEGGIWRTIVMGSTTSGANAAELAGYGIIAYDNKLNSAVPTQEFNVSIPLANSLMSNLINWIGGNYTLELENSFSAVEGFYFYIKNSSPSNGILTLNTTDPIKIDGTNTLSLLYNQSCIIIFDNITQNWKTVGLGFFGEGTGIVITAFGIELANGNPTNPSLSFISSTNTGIFTNGTNDISFSSAGTEIGGFTSTGVNLKTGNFTLGGDNILELAGIYP